MYYEIGYEKTKEKYIYGFKFYIYMTKLEHGVYLKLQDHKKNFIEDITVFDIEMGLQDANHMFAHYAEEWIEHNTNESDRIISDVMQW